MTTTRVDIRETVNCTCGRLRRAARCVTQLYGEMLEAAHLTTTQFTILVFLCREGGRSISNLAALIGTDPTTLSRNLKPLLKRRMVHSRPDSKDRRRHTVFVTEAGRAKVLDALPLWRQAEDRLAALCGVDATRTLNQLLDLTYDKVHDRSPVPGEVMATSRSSAGGR